MNRPTTADTYDRAMMVRRAGDLRRKLARKAAGICIVCGRQPATDGLFSCTECRTKACDCHRVLVVRRKAAGICIDCGKRPSTPNRTTCAECQKGKSNQYYIRKARKRLAEKGGIDTGITLGGKCTRHWDMGYFAFNTLREDIESHLTAQHREPSAATAAFLEAYDTDGSLGFLQCRDLLKDINDMPDAGHVYGYQGRGPEACMTIADFKQVLQDCYSSRCFLKWR